MVPAPKCLAPKRTRPLFWTPRFTLRVCGPTLNPYARVLNLSIKIFNAQCFLTYPNRDIYYQEVLDHCRRTTSIKPLFVRDHNRHLHLLMDLTPRPCVWTCALSPALPSHSARLCVWRVGDYRELWAAPSRLRQQWWRKIRIIGRWWIIFAISSKY